MTENSVSASKKTHYFSITKIRNLILLKGKNAVYSDKHIEAINILFCKMHHIVTASSLRG